MAKHGKAREKRLCARLVADTVEEMEGDWLWAELWWDPWHEDEP